MGLSTVPDPLPFITASGKTTGHTDSKRQKACQIDTSPAVAFLCVQSRGAAGVPRWSARVGIREREIRCSDAKTMIRVRLSVTGGPIAAH